MIADASSHLGRVRSFVNNDRMKRFLLSEAVARVAKNRIREEMRERMRREGSLSMEHAKETIASHFNCLLDSSDDDFWEKFGEHLLYRFEGILKPSELSTKWTKQLDIRFIIERIAQILGITLSAVRFIFFKVHINDTDHRVSAFSSGLLRRTLSPRFARTLPNSLSSILISRSFAHKSHP